MESRRVVVTGVGAVTPLGNTVQEFWENLCAGCSGVDFITHFDTSHFQTKIAAQVKNLIVPESISPRRTKRLDRFALFALIAALEAWQDAGLAPVAIDPYEIGVLIGSSHGGEASLLDGTSDLQTGNPSTVSPRMIPRMLANMASAQVAIHLGLHGPNFTVGSACATGAHAIGEAAEIIKRGDAVAMLCGGAEACITPLTVAGDQASGALSHRNDCPPQASRPFDSGRDGFVLGEGAGILVLEDYDHAMRRGAHIYAKITGYGLSSDALHETRPDPTGTHNAHAIKRALRKANIASSQVDAIFAHATGTVLGDQAETESFKQAFRDQIVSLPVTAIKGALGHLLGASGAVQAVAAIKALECQTIPPTLNLTAPDPVCALNVVTQTTTRPLTHVLSNSCGFGGQNVAILLSRVN